MRARRGLFEGEVRANQDCGAAPSDVWKGWMRARKPLRRGRPGFKPDPHPVAGTPDVISLLAEYQKSSCSMGSVHLHSFVRPIKKLDMV